MEFNILSFALGMIAYPIARRIIKKMVGPKPANELPANESDPH
jgi:hypothetical protein